MNRQCLETPRDAYNSAHAHLLENTYFLIGSSQAHT